MKAKRYRRTPQPVEAIQFTGDNAVNIAQFAGTDRVGLFHDAPGLQLLTTPGGVSEWQHVPIGHYVVRRSDGDYGAVDPHTFESNYEAEPE